MAVTMTREPKKMVPVPGCKKCLKFQRKGPQAFFMHLHRVHDKSILTPRKSDNRISPIIQNRFGIGNSETRSKRQYIRRQKISTADSVCPAIVIPVVIALTIRRVET